MTNPTHDEHESAIKTPKQLITVIVLSFVVPIIAIILLANYVSSSTKPNAGSDDSASAVATRIAPVAMYEVRDANAPKVYQTGEAVYKAVCAACHAAGAAGAPKVGDAGAWAARIKQGYDTIVGNAIKGIRGMPAKGGNPDLEDVEVARAVVFMSNQSGGSFKEPALPAPSAASAPAAASEPAKQ